jgi:hypothetical protein
MLASSRRIVGTLAHEGMANPSGTGRRLFAGDPRIAVLVRTEAATQHYACWGLTLGAAVVGLVTVVRTDFRHANTS